MNFYSVYYMFFPKVLGLDVVWVAKFRNICTTSSSTGGAWAALLACSWENSGMCRVSHPSEMDQRCLSIKSGSVWTYVVDDMMISGMEQFATSSISFPVQTNMRPAFPLHVWGQRQLCEVYGIKSRTGPSINSLLNGGSRMLLIWFSIPLLPSIFGFSAKCNEKPAALQISICGCHGDDIFISISREA